jgi:hypothetical protein
MLHRGPAPVGCSGRQRSRQHLCSSSTNCTLPTSTSSRRAAVVTRVSVVETAQAMKHASMPTPTAVTGVVRPHHHTHPLHCPRRYPPPSPRMQSQRPARPTSRSHSTSRALSWRPACPACRQRCVSVMQLQARLLLLRQPLLQPAAAGAPWQGPPGLYPAAVPPQCRRHRR